MTNSELAAEWKYRYAERLGILCGDAEPTREQIDMAYAEAERAIEDLKHENQEISTVR